MHILEISWFEVPISRFFWTFFQNLQICMWWGLEGLHHACYSGTSLLQKAKGLAKFVHYDEISSYQGSFSYITLLFVLGWRKSFIISRFVIWRFQCGVIIIFSKPFHAAMVILIFLGYVKISPFFLYIVTCTSTLGKHE